MDKFNSKEINLELIKDNTATQCRHCGNVATQKILFDERIQYDDGLSYYDEYIVLRCPVCHKVNILLRSIWYRIDNNREVIENKNEKIIYPKMPYNFEKLPREIQKIYNKLMSFINDAKSLLPLCRTLLESVFQDKGYKNNRDLNGTIKELEESKVITSDIAKCCNCIRIMGNLEIHNSADIIVQGKQIEMALNFIDFLLFYFYEIPNKYINFYNEITNLYKVIKSEKSSP